MIAGRSYRSTDPELSARRAATKWVLHEYDNNCCAGSSLASSRRGSNRRSAATTVHRSRWGTSSSRTTISRSSTALR
ncbi:maltose acetyltransferase domain-containing protein [Micropruina sp.]|uniref:maltose acetyltransferase domain-containing protein n=1 Tax=Micropruina sp. TaxID=2737536 RepID=UPI0039E550B7